ncbi:hypothetical protein BJX68DRAFT_249390 [Aspergillus pseudodeflectus]|uniref:Uncharacterized protein n=1 Tax=Aspergillus pseudodeflectus TaxID=176178 RepID=A0ABR4JDN8_9EURO
MVIPGDTICAALDKGGGVRFGPDTFAIYTRAPLPRSFADLDKNAALHTKLTAAAALVCQTLPVYVDLDATDMTQLASLPVPVPLTSNVEAVSNKTTSHPPWFLINAATIKKHCVVGSGSVAQALLVILQRPWCVLEICCTDPATIAAVLAFAQLAAQEDLDSYDASVRLLSYEQRARITPAPASAPITADISTPSISQHWPGPRCSINALRDIYAATTLTASYNRFWLPLICTCAFYLSISFSEVVRRIRKDLDVDGPLGEKERGSTWTGLYREILKMINECL